MPLVVGEVTKEFACDNWYRRIVARSLRKVTANEIPSAQEFAKGTTALKAHKYNFKDIMIAMESRLMKVKLLVVEAKEQLKTVEGGMEKLIKYVRDELREEMQTVLNFTIDMLQQRDASLEKKSAA